MRGAGGAVIPVSKVYCGPTPEPKHDTSPGLSHLERCSAYKASHLSSVNAEVFKLMAGIYDAASLAAPTRVMFLEPSVFSVLTLMSDGSLHHDVVFFGAIAGASSAAPLVKVVGFADFQLLAHNSDGSLTIRMTSDFCAFDQFGNVVAVNPDGCEEGFLRTECITRIISTILRTRNAPGMREDR